MKKRPNIAANTEVRGYPAAILSGPREGLFNAYVDFGPDTPWTPRGEVEPESYPVTYFDGKFVGVDGLSSEAEALRTARRLTEIYDEHRGA